MALAIIAASGALGTAAFLMYRVWTDTGDVAKSVAAPVTAVYDYFRVVRGTQNHTKPLDKPALDALTQEMAAVAIARDSTGEDARHGREVRTLMFDTMLRNVEDGLSIPDNFRKGHTFFPPGWNHQENAPLITRWTTGWVDRDLDKTRRTVPPDVMTEARDIVATRKVPDPKHCAVVVIRAEGTGATSWSGEKAARDWILRNMREDEALKTRGFRTRFFCPKKQ